MTKNTQSKIPNKGLYFAPLGGSEQFGVNLNLYVCDGHFLAIDCGLGFADERFPGIDLLLPDPQVLEDNADKLTGLIITHAHEDHIGAVAHLWPRFECPIYTSQFTANILRLKFEERGIKRPPIHEIEALESIDLSPFSFHLIPVAHSVPETRSVCIDTPYGSVIHSGDWNLDPSPVIGAPTQEGDFRDAAKNGILAYIGDSTNAEFNGKGRSESDVAKGLEQEITKCSGKVAITIFSSNVGRIQSIYDAAQACGREVGVVGRSLHRMIGAAKDCGYLQGCEFVPEEELGFVADNQTLIIMTGSQGEYRAALAKVARGEHRSVSLQRGDTVIFSARAIPGNEREIGTVKNNLSAGGIKIITPDDTENIIHVSGHPYRDEIAQMYQWLKPEIVIPVHGERMQLEAQAKFAKSCQVPHAIVPSNGSLIRLDGDAPYIFDHVETGLLAVDAKRLIKADHGSIVARRKLQYTGVIHISLVLNGNGKLLAEPKLDTSGLFDVDDADDQDMEDALFNEILDLLDDLSKKEILDDTIVEEKIRIGLRRFSYQMLKVKPKTSVHVLRTG